MSQRKIYRFACKLHIVGGGLPFMDYSCPTRFFFCFVLFVFFMLNDIKTTRVSMIKNMHRTDEKRSRGYNTFSC